jgi:hypothetical protein
VAANLNRCSNLWVFAFETQIRVVQASQAPMAYSTNRPIAVRLQMTSKWFASVQGL